MIPHGRLPKDGDDVTIGCGFGVVLRSSPPSLGHLTVRGTLKVIPTRKRVCARNSVTSIDAGGR